VVSPSTASGRLIVEADIIRTILHINLRAAMGVTVHDLSLTVSSFPTLVKARTVDP
jgi:hypothetical protein